MTALEQGIYAHDRSPPTLVEEWIRGIRCSVDLADVDLGDDREDRYPVRVQDDDTDLEVLAYVTRRTGEIWIGESVPEPYRSCARTFVRMLVPEDSP